MLSGIQTSLLDAQMREARGVSGTSRDQAKQDAVKKITFLEYFKSEMNAKVLRRQQSLWRGLLMRGLRSALYYAGHQILVPRANGLGFDIRHLRGADHQIYIMNKLRPFSDDAASQFVQLSPEIMFAVLSDSERVQERALDTINSVSDHFQHLHFTERFIQQCAQFGQFCGNYTAEIYFDQSSKQGREWVKNFRQSSLPSEDWYQCSNCNASGPQSDLQPPMQGMPQQQGCPTCGNSYINPIKMGGVQMDVLESEGWQKAGEVVCDFSPWWSHRFSLTTGADKSPWRYFEEDQARELIEAEYGKLDVEGDQRDYAEEHLHCQRLMRRAERARFGYHTNLDDENDDAVLMQRFWYEPEALANLQLKEDATLPSGEVIPVGERLSDVWPDGVCIKTVPGSNEFLDVYPECHSQRFVDGIYGLVPGSHVGDGITDAIEGQRQLNLLHSGEFKWTQKTLQPTVILKSGAFKDSRVFNLPDGVAMVNPSDMPPDGDIRKTFGILEPPQVSSRIPMLIERVTGIMQGGTKAFNSEGDFPGTHNDTATAAKIAVARNAGNHSLYLALWAGFMKEVRVRALELAQQHYGEMRIVQANDPQTNQRRAKVIKSIDLRQDLVAWVKPGSWMPDLSVEKRDNYNQGVLAWIQLHTAGLDSPPAMRQLDEVFQTDFASQKLRERVEACEEVLDTMQEGMLSALSQPDPAMYLYSLAPVDAYETGHEMKIAWWRDWLSSAEGRHANPILRQAVKYQIESEKAALGIERAAIAGVEQMGQGMVAPTQASGMQAGQQGSGVVMPPSDGETGTPGYPGPQVATNQAAGQPPQIPGQSSQPMGGMQ